MGGESLTTKNKMKWFKHLSDSHSNLKLEAVIDEFGMVGYGLFWLCDELIAQQGENFCIKAEKRWKNSLVKKSQMQVEVVEKILTFFGEMKLIDGDALTQGDLHIPKLGEYGDEYSSRKKIVGTMSGESRDNVGLDKIRRDKKRIEEVATLPDWLDKKVWNEWVEYRKEKKKSLTQRSIELQLKELAQNIPTHKAIIEQSIRNGWTGLFPLKEEPKKYNGPPERKYKAEPPQEKFTPDQEEARKRGLKMLRDAMTIKP